MSNANWRAEFKKVEFYIVDSAGVKHTITANGNYIEGDYVVFWSCEYEETPVFYKPISVCLDSESKL
jgi:hypothetical protein